MSNQLIIFSLINKKQFNKSQKIHKESFGWTQRFSLWLLVIFSFLKRERTVTVPWTGNVISQTTVYFLQFERFRPSNVPGCSLFLNVPRRLTYLKVQRSWPFISFSTQKKVTNGHENGHERWIKISRFGRDTFTL